MDTELTIISDLQFKIFQCRDEILEAFIAKYGCDPDEVEQVFVNDLKNSRWYVRKKIKEDVPDNSAYAD